MKFRRWLLRPVLYHLWAISSEHATFEKDLKRMATALEDLNAAVQKVSDAVTAAVADIQTLTAEIKAGNTINDPAIEDATNRLNAVADALNQAVNPPNPAPAA